MKVSRHWLQKFFDAPLPAAERLADELTFHAFEIEGIEKAGDDDILDVKVTPNRGHDCLSHRGIAAELSAILNITLANDPLREKPALLPLTGKVEVTVHDQQACARYIAGYIKGVRVGPSPQWLRERLEAIGQRSINNVVDATNFVMFNTGQPLHAFDAGQLSNKKAKYLIGVRRARVDEQMTALDGKEYTLGYQNLVITDGDLDKPVGIAGVKGGMPAAITEATHDIIIESANFDGATVRKSAQTVKLRTDASARFEQQLSPELAAYGMASVVELIQKLAGGEMVGFADAYGAPQQPLQVPVTVSQTKAVLGNTIAEADITHTFERLGFAFTRSGETCTVSVPFMRLDITIAEDLIEEVGRIVGYDKIPAKELPKFIDKPLINENFYAAEEARAQYMAKGYSEVYTSVFAERGERVVLNKADGVRPYLRSTLTTGLSEALKRNLPNKELLGLKEIKLFEIGAVWRDGREMVMLGTASETEGAKETPLAGQIPVSGAAHYHVLALSSATRFAPFSKYPYIVRDIAMWVPRDTDMNAVQATVQKEAGALAVRTTLFDRFEKAGKVSLAYRIIFQAFDRTLTEAEANAIMEKVTAACKASGWEVR